MAVLCFPLLYWRFVTMTTRCYRIRSRLSVIEVLMVIIFNKILLIDINFYKIINSRQIYHGREFRCARIHQGRSHERYYDFSASERLHVVNFAICHRRLFITFNSNSILKTNITTVAVDFISFIQNVKRSMTSKKIIDTMQEIQTPVYRRYIK